MLHPAQTPHTWFICAPRFSCQHVTHTTTTTTTGITCRPGFGGRDCSICRAGTYSNGGASLQALKPNCTGCPLGLSTLLPAATNVTACSSGYAIYACSRPGKHKGDSPNVHAIQGPPRTLSLTCSSNHLLDRYKAAVHALIHDYVILIIYDASLDHTLSIFPHCPFGSLCAGLRRPDVPPVRARDLWDRRQQQRGDARLSGVPTRHKYNLNGGIQRKHVHTRRWLIPIVIFCLFVCLLAGICSCIIATIMIHTLHAIKQVSRHTCSYELATPSPHAHPPLVPIGVVVCFGKNNANQSTPPDGLGDVIAVSAGQDHSCALTAVNRRVVCWGGSNRVRQLEVPAGLGPVASVSAGDYHTCALTVAGLVRCWGDTSWNKCRVPAVLQHVVAVSAGTVHSCAVTANGSAICWGSLYPTLKVPPNLGPVISIAAGYLATCAVTTARLVRCWGSAPDMSDLGPVRQVTPPSDGLVCALTMDGVVRCKGGNLRYFSRLDGLRAVSTVGAPVGFPVNHACALLESGALRCFVTANVVSDYFGEADVPADLATPGGTLSVSVAPAFTCAIVPKRELQAGQALVPAFVQQDLQHAPPIMTFLLATHVCPLPAELPCRPGFGGRYRCLPCPAGSWSQGGAVYGNPDRLVPPCSPCPTGLGTLSEGASSAEQCVGGPEEMLTDCCPAHTGLRLEPRAASLHEVVAKPLLGVDSMRPCRAHL